ncbi:unnamed protein product [Echinostoma caproni]|uniref:Legumain n=1 Tax=Echinostoma caproni TaxID=27848 RepID=A0A183AJT1_9TREM|nr:unnamed protein product [Echinostoma caproni]
MADIALSSLFTPLYLQADIAHAYQLLRQNGIPKETIVTMAFDDIAYSPHNIFPGKIFNDYTHTDVYEGFEIDYRGELYAQQLTNALKRMRDEKRFNKAVVYIEACYSGSMFEDLLRNDINVYATSAANSEESSWASFCDDSQLDTCLADDYSYNWMKDTAQTMGNLPIGEFQSYKPGIHKSNRRAMKFIPTTDKVSAQQAHLVGMMRTVMRTNDVKKRAVAQRRLNRALQLAHLVTDTFDDIVTTITETVTPENDPRTNDQQLDCYKEIFDAFQVKCFTIQQVPQVATELVKFENLCRRGYDTKKMVQVILDMCG